VKIFNDLIGDPILSPEEFHEEQMTQMIAYH
jgi:hypothetical protein